MGELPKGKERLRSLEEIEREAIRDTLETFKFHLSKSCDVLGISRATLYRKMKLYGVNRPKARFSHE